MEAPRRSALMSLVLGLLLIASAGVAQARERWAFVLQTGTALHETGPGMGEWSFAAVPGSGTWPDIVALSRSGTGTNSTEVHMLDGAASPPYSRFKLQTGTALHETGAGMGVWSFAAVPNLEDSDRDHWPDIVAISRSGTGTKSTEVHILDGGAPRPYSRFKLQTGTALHETGPGMGEWSFLAVPGSEKWPDVVALSRSGTGSKSTEVHILDGAASPPYSRFKTQRGTALHETGSSMDVGVWSFAAVPTSGPLPDIVALKQSATGTNSTELHILDAGANPPYSRFKLQTGTTLHETGPGMGEWSFAVAQSPGQIVALSRSGTGTGKTEVHILSAPPTQVTQEGSGNSFVRPAVSTPDDWIRTATRDWMNYLTDDVLLREISIPGTHDSGAINASAGGDAFWQTQAWSLGGQLEAGIRYLDIRCRIYNDRFTIHHGPYYLNLNFDDVLRTVQGFLTRHPSETVLMRVKEEYTPVGSSKFEAIFKYYSDTYRGLFLETNRSFDNLRLGDVRGKVLVLRDAWNLGPGTSFFDAKNFQDCYAVLNLQNADDNCDPSKDTHTVSLFTKKKKVSEFIRRAMSESTGILNGLNGSTHMSPEEVTWYVNPHAYDEIGPPGRARHVGIIAMDFPGEKLIYRIVATNFASP